MIGHPRPGWRRRQSAGARTYAAQQEQMRRVTPVARCSHARERTTVLARDGELSYFSTRRRGRVSASVDLIRTADRPSCRDGRQAAAGDADASFARRGHEWRHAGTTLRLLVAAPQMVKPYGYGFNWSRTGARGGQVVGRRRLVASVLARRRVRSSLGYADRPRRVAINANRTHTCARLSILFRFCVLGPIRSCAIRRDHDRPS